MLFRLREVTGQLWVRVLLFSAAGIALALLSARVGPWLPYEPSIDLASGAVGDLLSIIASSMLAVTTFSLSIVVATYAAATSNATPRAVTLLVGDPVAQSALAVFIGSFAFSIVGIIGLYAGVYDGSARVILFLATLGLVVLIAWAMIRWVNHLSDFGRVGDIVRMLEEAATKAAVAAGATPSLGAQPGPAPGIGPESPVLAAAGTGYLRHVDVAALDEAAAAAGVTVQLDHAVGDFAVEGTPLGRVSRPLPPEVARGMQDAFIIGRQRSFDQDMIHGLVVLSEVGSRALSPAVNDPGTAIDVLRAGTRVLLAHHAARSGAEPAGCRHVHAPDLDIGTAYRSFFAPIARDGAGLLEVQLVLQDALAALAERAPEGPARTEARDALERALAALPQPRERRLLRDAAAAAQTPAAAPQDPPPEA